jgi:uncharacterized protein YggE
MISSHYKYRKENRMNRNIIPVLVLICILIIFNYTVFAEELPDSTKGTISTTGTATSNYPPDTAEIILAIETTEKTVSEASQKNNTISDKVINALKAILDEAKGDRIKTSAYTIHPKYEYDSTRKKNEFVGYLVTNQITVKTGNISSTGKLIDIAVEQGSNRVHNINFTISDDNKYCEELLDKATRRGKFEAEVVARSLGTAITGIKSAASSCSDISQPPISPRFFAQEAVTSKSTASIEPGSIKLVGSVSLVFFIDNSN